VVVNVNPLYTPRELEHQLRDSGAKAIFVLENFARTVEQVLVKTDVRHVVVTSLGEMLGAKGLIVNLLVRSITHHDIGRITQSFRQLAPVIAAAQSLGFLGDDRSPIVQPLVQDVVRLGRLKTLSRWSNENPLMLSLSANPAAMMVNDFISVVYEYVNTLLLLDASGVYFGARDLRTHCGALLRVVEERRVTRLGGTTGTDVRARIIASSATDVEDAVRDGSLRADLFHRLSVLPVRLPPLRERPDDILPLARACLSEVAERLERQPPRLTADAEDALVRYHWPGNVRELRHVLERVLLAGVGNEIPANLLPMEVLEGQEAYLAPGVHARPTLDDVERRYIELTLTYARGNQTRAAAILGISRKALWEKRKRFGLR